MLRNSLKAIGLSFVISLTGCTLIPGSHIEGVSQSESNLDEDLNSIKVTVIDSKIIQSQNLAIQQKHSLSKNSKAPSYKGYDYKIGVGDVLSIGVWDHPELTIPAAVQRTAEFDGFRVQSNGTITFAYASNLKAEGRTIPQLRWALVKRLEKVIEKPQVDIKVVGFNSQKAYVTGEVKNPGIFAISDVPLTLIDALNKAGGLTDDSDWREVTFTRNGNTEVIKVNEFYAKGDISQNRLLQHGDIIHVGRVDNQKVFVLGDVVEAGSVKINRYGLTLAEAIAEAGGLNEHTANANGLFVLRKRNHKKDGIIADVFQLHAQNAVALVLADQFQLKPHDIVYVTTAPIARWNRVISQLLPTITAIDRLDEIEAR